MTSQFRTIIEPFRIKSVEPIRMTTVAEREEKLRAIDYARRGQIALAGGDPGVYRPSAVVVP